MPAPVISGLLDFVAKSLNISVWDGEVPRTDATGVEINPDAPDAEWPVIRASMPEQGLAREWTTEDSYTDQGPISVDIWGTTRTEVETKLNEIDELLANSNIWSSINLGAGFEVFMLLLQTWYSGQEENVRTRKSELLYRGELRYQIGVNGGIKTR